jgi:hypothetical protein
MRKPTAKKRDSADIAFESGSGNVFADLGIENAEEEQLKVDLAVRLNEILAPSLCRKPGLPSSCA